MQERKLNRLETTRQMGPLVDRHWAAIREAKQRGEKTAWCMALLFPWAYAMGIRTHFHAGYAAYVGGRKLAPPFLDQAEEVEGHLVDTCSYHRLHIGLISMLLKGKDIPEQAYLPVPDAVLLARVCTEHSHQTDSIYRYLKERGMDVPVLTVDIMPSHREEDVERQIQFVKRQIYEDVIPGLERLCDKKFDYDRLSEIVAVTKRTALLRDECMNLMKHKPAPGTIFDMAVSMAPVIYMMGDPVGEAYYKELKAEMVARIANGVGGVVPEEKFRVYWDGWMVWGWVGAMARKLTSFGANAILGRYAPMEMFSHAEELDPEHPVDTLVDQFVRHMCRGNLPEKGMNTILKWVQDYSLDALIMHNARTCRLWNLGQQDILDEAERRLGVPGILLEADMIDPKFYSEAQIDNRLQAMFEMVEARRKA